MRRVIVRLPIGFVVGVVLMTTWAGLWSGFYTLPFFSIWPYRIDLQILIGGALGVGAMEFVWRLLKTY